MCLYLACRSLHNTSLHGFVFVATVWEAARHPRNHETTVMQFGPVTQAVGFVDFEKTCSPRSGTVFPEFPTAFLHYNRVSLQLQGPTVLGRSFNKCSEFHWSTQPTKPQTLRMFPGSSVSKSTHGAQPQFQSIFAEQDDTISRQRAPSFS